MKFAVSLALAAAIVAGHRPLNAQVSVAASASESTSVYDPMALQPPHLLNEYAVPSLMRFYYPPALLKNPVNDQVIVTFTVDTLGAPDMSSIQVIKGEHKDIIAATKSVVAKLKFTPGWLRTASKAVPVTVTLPLVWAAR